MPTPLARPKTIAPESEANLRQQVARGRKTEALMNDPGMAGAFHRLEEMYIHAWRATAPEEVAKRERAYTMLYCLADLREALQKQVDDGDMARNSLHRAGELDV